MAIELTIYDVKGSKVGTQRLPEEVFGVPENDALVYQAYTVKLANQKRNYAHVKDRSEVRGGGRKPWRQKGTGRARHGSNRSPLWVGGGVTFGPRNERMSAKRIGKKMNRKALAIVLSSKVRDGALSLVDSLSFDEPKTKQAQALLAALERTGTSTVVFGAPGEKNFSRAFSNIPRVTPRSIGRINIVDVLQHSNCVMSQAALAALVRSYGVERAAKKPQKAPAVRAKQ